MSQYVASSDVPSCTCLPFNSSSPFKLSFSKVVAPTLILRATKWLSAEDDLLLPQEVAEQMVREIPNARNVDVEGTNHYSIVFQPNEIRDQALLDFLK